MIKNIKKYMTFLCAVCLIFGLTACGAKKDATANADTSKDSEITATDKNQDTSESSSSEDEESSSNGSDDVNNSKNSNKNNSNKTNSNISSPSNSASSNSKSASKGNSNSKANSSNNADKSTPTLSQVKNKDGVYVSCTKAKFGSLVTLHINDKSIDKSKVKYFQVLVKDKPISKIATISKDTTIYPDQKRGAKVQVRIFDKNQKPIKTIESTIVENK